MIKLIAVTLGIATLATMAGYASGKVLSVPVQPVSIASMDKETFDITSTTTPADNGKEKKIVPLEKPYEGLYISNDIWREMYDFSPDAVLLVLASEIYDNNDYIRDYDEFLKFVGAKNNEQ